jgi:hypothetical protein
LSAVWASNPRRDEQIKESDVDVLLRVWAVLLILAGVPGFLGLMAMFVGAATTPLPDDDGVMTRFLMLYTAMALSGLLSASGCLLWAVVKLAYPKRKSPPI